MNKHFLVLCVFLVTIPVAMASTWYVDGVKGNDNNDCMSRQTACKTIGHTISLASSGDSIMVTAATYFENLVITKSLAILGSGRLTTVIDGEGSDSVVIVDNSNARVALSGFTIRNGASNNGAGIWNNGRLGISGCEIVENSANGGCKLGVNCLGGGIYNEGNLTIRRSHVADNKAGDSQGRYGEGGGIYSVFATTTIIRSTIDGNHGFAGAGIEAILGTMTIESSTISSNFSGGGGAGIDNESTTAIDNSTISGNNSSGVGGGINNGGTLVLSNSTVAENTAPFEQGAGIRNWSGTTRLQNTLVANNSQADNCIGAMLSNGYNLSSDDTCNFNGPGDLNNTDPMLGRLRDNGGPTQTQALLRGSPAIDAGNPSGCVDGQGHLLKTDQRGAPRPDPEDQHCDIGAYELQNP